MEITLTFAAASEVGVQQRGRTPSPPPYNSMESLQRDSDEEQDAEEGATHVDETPENEQGLPRGAQPDATGKSAGEGTIVVAEIHPVPPSKISDAKAAFARQLADSDAATKTPGGDSTKVALTKGTEPAPQAVHTVTKPPAKPPGEQGRNTPTIFLSRSKVTCVIIKRFWLMEYRMKCM